jgi:CBS domain containing-hemolysin-like protein
MLEYAVEAGGSHLTHLPYRSGPGKMTQLFFVVLTVLSISFLCSLLEAVLLTMTRPYIQTLIDKKNRSGRTLLSLKERIEEPISAILTLNTVANTVGATVAGALALQVFGSQWMALFSAGLAFLVLTFSEIIPKTLGAHYWKSLGPFSAYLLKGMVLFLKPLIVPMNALSKWLRRGASVPAMSKEEIRNAVRIGYFSGVLQPSEFEIMENLFRLRSVQVKDIMTPRTVAFWLPPEQKIKELLDSGVQLPFSRIPLYNAHENAIEGVVLRRDIMTKVAEQQAETELKSLARPPEFIIDKMTVYKLLNLLISQGIHLAIVLNEYGDFTGIVTMEDAIETLLGKEIVDEFDDVVDMRELARRKRFRFLRRAQKEERADRK